MRKIASEVGMGAMTIYKYFENKNEILRHIWSDFFEELFDEIEDALHNDRSRFSKEHAHTINSICKIYLNYWFRHPDRFRMVFLNEDRASKENTFFVQDANIEARLNLILFPVIKKAMPQKSDEDIQNIMLSLLCYLNGIALNKITISEYSWPDHSTLLDIYLNAIFHCQRTDDE